MINSAQAVTEAGQIVLTVGRSGEEPSEQIFAKIAASPMPSDDEEAKRMASQAMAMFDAESYRFRATIARPLEG